MTRSRSRKCIDVGAAAAARRSGKIVRADGTSATLRGSVADLNTVRDTMIARLNRVRADIAGGGFGRMDPAQQRATLAEMGAIADLGRGCLDRILRIRRDHRHLPHELRIRLVEEAAWLTSTVAMADGYATRVDEVPSAE